MAVEVEAVRAALQDGRHELSISPRDGLVRPEAVNLGPLEGARPVGFTDGDALAETRYHVAGQPFQRLLLFLPLTRPLNQITACGVLQQPCGDLPGFAQTSDL